MGLKKYDEKMILDMKIVKEEVLKKRM